MRLLWLIPTVIAMNWLQRNKQFHGTLDENVMENRVLYTAPTGQTIKELSIFSQWPITVFLDTTPPPPPAPSGCAYLLGCDSGCTVNPFCETTQLCQLDGGVPWCSNASGPCVAQCNRSAIHVIVDNTIQVTVDTCHDGCYPVTNGPWSGWAPNLTSGCMKGCYDAKKVGVCVQNGGIVTLECRDMCQNVAISDNKWNTDLAQCKANLDAMWTLPISASECVTWSPNATTTIYYRLRLVTGTPDMAYLDLYDRYCTILQSSTLIDIPPGVPTCYEALKTYPSVPTSIVQGYSFNVDYCDQIQYIPHCEPVRGVVNEWVFLPVQTQQDDTVQACWDSGDTPMCVYERDIVTTGKPIGYTYACEPYCWIDTLWLSTDGGIYPATSPVLATCLSPPSAGGPEGLNAQLELGEPTMYKQTGWCSPNDRLISGGPTPNVRITPFLRKNVSVEAVVLRVEVFSRDDCMIKVDEIIEDSNFCFDEYRRRTYAPCTALRPHWTGDDGYGCHSRHVAERVSTQELYWDTLSICQAGVPPSCFWTGTECQVASAGGCPNSSICQTTCVLTPPGFNCVAVCDVNPAFAIPFINTLKREQFPNELAPSTISCLQGGGAPYCQSRAGGPNGASGYFGACDSLCYWTDQYSCALGNCGYNGIMTPLFDIRNALQHAGQCGYINFATSSSDYTTDIVPPGNWDQFTSVRGWYYNSQIAFRFSRARACDANAATTTSGFSVMQSYQINSCWSNNPQQCFASLPTTQQTTMKIATCEEACGHDGYGCTYQDGVSSGIAQLSCPTSQACFAGCPANIGLITGLAVACQTVLGYTELVGQCNCNVPLLDKYATNYSSTNAFLDDMARTVGTIAFNDTPRHKVSLSTTLSKRAKRYQEVELLGCALGVALVLDRGQNPVMSLVDGQPLVTPQLDVIFAAVYEITINAPEDASLVPFEYYSQQDTTWIPPTLNVGETVRLLAFYYCSITNYSITFDYDGTFNYLV